MFCNATEQSSDLFSVIPNITGLHTVQPEAHWERTLDLSLR